MNSKPDTNSWAGETRRSFIKKTASLAAAASASGILRTPVYGQSQSPSANVIGANNRLVVGYIGTGKQGMEHVRSQKSFAHENNIAQAAACDLYQKHLESAKKHLGPADADGFADHRRLLERKDIDAVVIATVDNWHAPAVLILREWGRRWERVNQVEGSKAGRRAAEIGTVE